MDIKKVSIIGCGALGIMYASHMSKKIPTDQIQFVADEDRVEKYRGSEFYANGIRRHFNFAAPDENTQPSDLVIFAVKYNQLPDAIRIAKNCIGEHTIILSFLNGISSEEIIGKTYNSKKILYCMVAGMDATRDGNSVCFTKTGYIALGKLSNDENDQDLKDAANFFDRVEIKNEIHDNIMKTIWWKYILNIGINQCSALLKSTYGLFHTVSYAETMARMAMDEAYQVSRAMGIGLQDEDIENCIKIIKTLSPDGKTSMCQDIEARRPTEVDMFSGTLMELGKEYNVPVPVNTFLFHAIKAIESEF